MKISAFKLKNYRRLLDVELILGDQKTVLVGANNSGKTSCIGALHTFLMRPDNIRIRDSSKLHWDSISQLGERLLADEIDVNCLSSIGEELSALLPFLDIVISANSTEAYKVRDILPSLNWNGEALFVRMVYKPDNLARLAADYKKARSVVLEHPDVALWPKNFFDFLERGKNLPRYFKQQQFIISALNEPDSHSPPNLRPLPSGTVKKLVRVDVISEQRGLGQEDSSAEKGAFSEKQRLNGLLRGYYDRFLNPDDFPEQCDLEVLQKQQEMEVGFTGRLETQFAAPLSELRAMGYPGIGGNPSVQIVAKFSGTDALQKASSVRYKFDGDQEDSLPESYLGLGFQNLIYLTFRLLGFRDRWMRKGKFLSSDDELSAFIEPIHLVLVEEPEVNLHAQVQRVFIRNAYDTLRNHERLKITNQETGDVSDNPDFQTQLVVSTHSSHVVDDVNFKDLRYFKRTTSDGVGRAEYSCVENLSGLFSSASSELKFVSKHLKLTHCDLFFADGVIFVEGQAERLLVPEFIKNTHPRLANRYLSILEVNGAHTHKYRPLIEKLGLATLIITDLDSQNSGGNKSFPEIGENQTTNNYTLSNWHPCVSEVDELVKLSTNRCVNVNSPNPLFVAYQREITINKESVLSRTFEDALILANFNDPYFLGMPKIAEAKCAW